MGERGAVRPFFSLQAVIAIMIPIASSIRVSRWFGVRVTSVMRCALVLLLVCAFSNEEVEAATTYSMSELRCEYLTTPTGIESLSPRLSWIIEASARGQKQTAYRIVVATSRALLNDAQGDLWDTGRVVGGNTSVAYAGKPLESRAEYFWKVKSWDKDGNESGWSASQQWSMGLLKPADWTAHWITYNDKAPLHKDRSSLFLPPARQYRKEFTADKPIRRATVYASALGLYELHLNGNRVSEALFTPGWSDYRQRAYYNTYDVTKLVKGGSNAIGAIVTDGWYSGYVGYGLLVGYGPNRVGRYFYGKTPALLAQLEIEYVDGSKQTIATDTTWQVSDNGPIREADLIMGESYDARLEQPAWTRAEFNATAWEAAVAAGTAGPIKALFSDVMGDREVDLGFHKPARMQAYPAPPIDVHQEISAVGMNEQKPGVYIYDLGQNFAGVARLKLKGRAGTKVQIRFGEMLHPDGRLMTENLRRARATDYYILRGDESGEIWTPRFTYHGFRYVEITGLTEKPAIDAVTGVVIGNLNEPTGSFECSDPMVNRLYKNIVWTQMANFIELPTDCPQRDERLGWMGDAQIYARTATFNSDVAAFYTKWLDDVEEAQRSSGAYPDYCPYPMAHGQKGKNFGTAWTDAGVIVPWTLWKVYGDTRVIERHYESMNRFMAFRKSLSPTLKGVSAGNPWGDWLNMNETTPVEYVDICYHAHSASLMADMAAAIGRKADAQAYQKLLSDITAVFQATYVNPDGSLKVATQTAYVLALDFDLVPESLRHAAAERLAAAIAKNDYRMATGFLGTKPLLTVLTANGQHELAVRLFQSRRFPSWGYEVENGATSVWERWDSYTKDHGFDGIAGKNNAAMNSFSHYSFGAVCEWMFRSLAGIDSDGEGYDRITLRPGMATAAPIADTPPMTWVKAGYRCRHGLIQSAWKVEGARFEWMLVVPPNTSATAYIPGKNAGDVTESGKALNDAAEVQVIGVEGSRVKLRLGSGSYQFVSILPQ